MGEDDDDIHDLVALYALDALGPDERDEFEAHLDSCESCRAEVGHLMEGAAHLATAVAVSPPTRVKTRVMAEIGRRHPTTTSVPQRRDWKLPWERMGRPECGLTRSRRAAEEAFERGSRKRPSACLGSQQSGQSLTDYEVEDDASGCRCGRSPRYLIALKRSPAVSATIGCGKVECRIPIKEVEGPELEPIPDRGSHRPVFCSRGVVESERVPDHQVGVLDGTVRARPPWKTVSSFALVGIGPRRITLLWIVGGHPKVILDEAGALLRKVIRTKQRNRVGSWHQLITCRVAEPSKDIGIDDTPE